jgi:ferric-dicitrate binding protein FerR (iron transport regulator)
MQEHENFKDKADLDALLRAAELTAQQKLSDLSTAEAAELKAWLEENPQHSEWQQKLDKFRLQELLSSYTAFKDSDKAAWEKFRKTNLPAPVPPVSRIHFLKTAWFRYAAVALVVTGIGTYLWMNKSNKSETIVKTEPLPVQTDIAPGRDGAILTLADGRKMLLDTLGNGVIAYQHGAELILKNGQLTYAVSGKPAGEIAYNTMSTPKGRQFRVTMPDGTGVWLNSASSIRYPTVFAGNERRVEITGEVYFEVSKNSNLPFKVSAANTEVVVLGTRFNVNAYANEPNASTSLLQGAVQVNSGNSSAVLKPGQQARVQTASAGGNIKVLNKVNIQQVINWKNGLFSFEHADIPTVMRQLERWYDIEVQYEGAVPVNEIHGELGRDLSLQQILKVLQQMKVNCKLEGRKLIVYP